MKIALFQTYNFSAELSSSILAGRIAGGKITDIKYHPHQVSVQKYGLHECSGSIISANYVVTSGRCVDGIGTRSLTVRAGGSHTTTGGNTWPVGSIIVHEKFEIKTWGVPINDIAVLKVKSPIYLDETRQLIKLFEKDERAESGAAAVVSGWGDTGSGQTNHLRMVNIPIVNKDTCNDAYKRYGGIFEGQICAGEAGKGSCQGDSGGPLTISGKLAGIVSWRVGCDQGNYPGVFTEIAHYRDWIKNNTNI